MKERHKGKFDRLAKKTGALLTDPQLWIWLYPLLLIVPNIGLAVTETYPVTIKIANILLPLGIFMVIMGLFRRTGAVILWFLPVAVLCAFQIVLLFLYGESIIAIDMFLNVLTTNAAEVQELLGNLVNAIVTVIVIYLPPLVIAVMMLVRHRKADKSQRRPVLIAGGIVAAVCLILMTVSALTEKRSRPARQMFPYNVICNIFSAGERTVQSAGYHETSADFSYGVTPTHDPVEKEIYVFVIGETSRASEWSLFGYDRLTTPRLQSKDGLVGFSRTLSEVNTTHKSVPMLMSGLDSHSFGDSVAIVKSIFSAFNDAGYDTHYISNQRRNRSYIDFYGEEAHNSLFLTDSGAPRPDLDLTAEFDKAVNNSKAKKIFVVLHTYGSHFEYNKRYPREMAVFKPDSNSAAKRGNRPQLVNAYDNTIHYTDSLLSSLITALDKTQARAALLYVSDHGEDIYDDARGRFLHASPVPTYQQLHVPMVMWMSESLRAAEPGKWQAAQTNRDRDVSSSRSVFHTLMDLAGLRSRFVDSHSSLVSPSYVPLPHTYLNDYNESVPLGESGLRDPDFTELRRKGFAL
ncbi:MAG: sulfatase-like hydrolase/transferase [Muribaculaceae bacterium]